MTSAGNRVITPLPITAYSVSCASGTGTQRLYDALISGQTCLRSPRLITTGFPACTGEITDEILPALDPQLVSYSTRNTRIALAALDHPDDGLRSAVERAVQRYGSDRIGVVIGTSTSGIYETENCYIDLEKNHRLPDYFSFTTQHVWSATANYLKLELGLCGPCYAISTACSSSSKTLASAQRLIATGVCDAVLTGGVDSLCRLTLNGFKSLDIMSETPCTPLDRNRNGISIGEGAGLLLLEKPHDEHAACVHLLGFSSSKTLASAQRLIATGVCDAVLTGGVDSLCRLTLNGFKSLDIMSETPCTPLDRNRNGISIGEGAGLLLLEKPHDEHAACVHLLGCGESSDAYHMTAPHPEGRGAIAAMHDALAQASIEACQIDYVNLHATGTVLNDQAEMRAMETVFGSEIYCSGTKGLIGHTLGAAGGIESIIGCLSLVKRFRPGTCGLDQPEESFHTHIVKTSETDIPVNAVMNNNFGFGGNNTSLVLGWRHE